MNEKAKYCAMYLGQKMVTQKVHPGSLYSIADITTEVFFRASEEELRSYKDFNLF